MVRTAARAHPIATHTAELIDHSPEPDRERDRTLVSPWARYELVARDPPPMSLPALADAQTRDLVSSRRRASQPDALDQMTPTDHRAARTPDARPGLPIDVKLMPTPATRPGQTRIHRRAAAPCNTIASRSPLHPRRRRPQDAPPGTAQAHRGPTGRNVPTIGRRPVSRRGHLHNPGGADGCRNKTGSTTPARCTLRRTTGGRP
jgi:hypothetical protein